MFVYFDPDGSVDWESFFTEQSGSNGFRAGSTYQRGSGSFAQLLGKLFMSAVPVLKRVGRSIGREALLASSKVASDISEGRNLLESVKSHGNQGYQQLVEKAVNKLQQSGSGVKRKKPRKVTKRKQKAKKKPQKKKKPYKRTITNRDIFGKWPVS